MENEFRQGKWYLGGIIGIEERFEPYHYLDIYIKSKEILAPKVKLSVPYNLTGDSWLTKILNRLKTRVEGLKGKEVMYKFYLKATSENKDHPFKLVKWNDIKDPEAYEEDKYIFDKVNELKKQNEDKYLVGNKFIEELITHFYEKDNSRIPKKPTYIPKKNEGAHIKLFRKGVNLPINIIDFDSFYPSIILTKKLNPRNDIRRHYTKILFKLYGRKKELSESHEDPEELQKIKAVTESMVGCLNNKDFRFEDPKMHAEILKEGNGIIKKVIDFIEAEKKLYAEKNMGWLNVIRVHTDGLILRVRKDECINQLLPKLNKFLQEKEESFYNLRHDGAYMRGIFKDANNFVLFNINETPKIKGAFFKDYEKLVYEFLNGYYPKNYTEYEKEKKRLLKKDKNKRLLKVLNFLEKNKYI